MQWVPIVCIQYDRPPVFRLSWTTLDTNFAEGLALNATHFYDVLGTEAVLIDDGSQLRDVATDGRDDEML